MTELLASFLVGLVLAVMLVGLAGTVLPALPGLTLMWLAALIYGLFAGFGTWGPWLFGLITVLTVIGEASGYFLMHAGAAKTGASGWAVAASAALGLIGLFLIPVFGALIGAVLGVFLVEYYRRRSVKEALLATTGALWGFGLTVGLQFVIGLVIMAAWGLWVIVR